MGYYTSYWGTITIIPALPPETIAEFNRKVEADEFADRNLKSCLPIYPDWYCFVVRNHGDETCISHESENQGEGTYYYTDDWFKALVKFLSDHRHDVGPETFGYVPSPKDEPAFEVNGEIEWDGEESGDLGRLRIEYDPEQGFIPIIEKGVVTYVREN